MCTVSRSMEVYLSDVQLGIAYISNRFNITLLYMYRKEQTIYISEE